MEINHCGRLGKKSLAFCTHVHHLRELRLDREGLPGDPRTDFNRLNFIELHRLSNLRLLEVTNVVYGEAYGLGKMIRRLSNLESLRIVTKTPASIYLFPQNSALVMLHVSLYTDENHEMDYYSSNCGNVGFPKGFRRDCNSPIAMTRRKT